MEVHRYHTFDAKRCTQERRCIHFNFFRLLVFLSMLLCLVIRNNNNDYINRYLIADTFSFSQDKLLDVGRRHFFGIVTCSMSNASQMQAAGVCFEQIQDEF